MSCDRKVSISFPCALPEGHSGVCQPDLEGQLRLYGVTLEAARQIQRDLNDARRLGLIRDSGGTPTPFGRYVRLVAGLERVMPRGGRYGLVAASDVWAAIDKAGAEEKQP